MAEAVAQARKPFKLIGILPEKFQEKIIERSENKTMDGVMKEVYDQMGIRNIKELLKDFENLINKEESPHDIKLADKYYQNKEISDFARRSMNADKRSIRDKLVNFGTVAIPFIAGIVAPNLFKKAVALAAKVTTVCPWLTVAVAGVSAAVVIRRLIKSRRGNYYDGKQKSEETEKELIELVSKLEMTQKEIDAKKQEFINAKNTMSKKEYLAWMKNQVSTIVAKANGVIEVKEGQDPNNTNQEPVVKPEGSQEPVKPDEQTQQSTTLAQSSQEPVKPDEQQTTQEPVKPDEQQTETSQEGPAL